MRAVIYFSAFIILQLACVSARIKIPFRCHYQDMECTRALMQKLVLPLSETLDPMYIDFLSFNEGGFNGDLTNVTVTGGRNTIVDKTVFDFRTRQIILQYHTDIKLKGYYKSTPVDAGTDASMFIRNLYVKLTMPFEVIRNAINHQFINLRAFKYDYEIRDDLQSYINDLHHQALQGESFSETQNLRFISMPLGRSAMDKMMVNVFETLKSYLLSEQILNFFVY